MVNYTFLDNKIYINHLISLIAHCNDLVYSYKCLFIFAAIVIE